MSISLIPWSIHEYFMTKFSGSDICSALRSHHPVAGNLTYCYKTVTLFGWTYQKSPAVFRPLMYQRSPMARISPNLVKTVN